MVPNQLNAGMMLSYLVMNALTKIFTIIVIYLLSMVDAYNA